MAKVNEQHAQSLQELRPSELPAAIRAERKAGRSIMLWGPPGVAKSAICQSVATSLGIAFIDVRLSQMSPTDLRGIPYTFSIGGETGVKWSVPFIMPKNLDLRFPVDVLPMEETEVRFMNPLGSNGIHYVRAPKIEARSLTKGATARIVVRSEDVDATALAETGERDGAPAALTIGDDNLPASPKDRFFVALVNSDGDFVEGKVRIRVTGRAAGLLGLEEFNSAVQSVQAAAYQLVLDRRLGEYDVPEDVYIMAMGNRETDRGVAFKMPTPVRNRFVHATLVPHFEDWQAWAIGARIHPEVIGFLSNFDHFMFQFDPTLDLNAFPTPRSWEFVSDLLKADEDLTIKVERALICGSVGDAVGAQFYEFRQIAEQMPDPEEILQGRLKTMPKTKAIDGQEHLTQDKADISMAYALTTIMCFRLKDRAEAIRKDHPKDWKSSKRYAEWVKQADCFLEFMLRNFKTEVCVMGAKAAISIHRLPFDTVKQEYFDVFCEKFKGMIIN